MIIGLVGFKQVGKSTAAKHLEGRGFVRINMKDALVAEIKKNFPDLLREIFTHTDLYGDLENHPDLQSTDDLFEFKPPLMRALMQNYGTEVRRGDNDSYWTDQWKEAVENCSSSHIVVDDVRFLNEAEAVKEQGGIIVRLTRPDISTGGDHSSETEQLQIVADHTIECEAGGHGALYNALDKIILPPENWFPND